MDKLYMLLADIKKLPQLYLGKLSFERFHSFIQGYCHDNVNVTEGCCLDGFTEFVAKHYKMNTDHDWFGLIQFFNPDDQYAFNEFYRLLYIYMKRRSRKKPGAKKQIDCVTYNDFVRLSKRREEDYYCASWTIYQDIIQRVNIIQPAKILEHNPYMFTIARDSDILCKDVGKALRVESSISTKVITHDAADTPWPIADKSYDLFISLYSVERLEGKQAAVFQEIKRIAKHAMLGFPFFSTCPLDNEICPASCTVDDSILDEWTNHEQFAEGFGCMGNDGRGLLGERMIYLWHF